MPSRVASVRPSAVSRLYCLRVVVMAKAKSGLRFSTRARMVEGETSTDASVLLSSNCSFRVSPAAIATVPARAMMMPLLRTSGASSAM